MIDSHNNKGSPKFQGVNAQSDKKAFHTQFTPPTPSKSEVNEPPTPDKAKKTDYMSTNDVAKIIGVDRTTVIYWRKQGLFTADMIDHAGVYYYTVERVTQLKAVYHPNWKRGGYQPSSTTSEPEPVKEVPTDYQPKGKKQFQKISDTTIESINRLSPDELETHGIIQSARVSGYVCPLCSSGDGSHGTGMTQNPKIENHTVSLLTLCSCALFITAWKSAATFLLSLKKSARTSTFPLSMKISLFIPLFALRHESRVNSRLSTPKS